jgi:hypothetical protein
MKDEKEVVKIRLSKETKTEIQKNAEKVYRTFDAQCRLILDEWVKKQKDGAKTHQ